MYTATRNPEPEDEEPSALPSAGGAGLKGAAAAGWLAAAVGTVAAARRCCRVLQTMQRGCNFAAAAFFRLQIRSMHPCIRLSARPAAAIQDRLTQQRLRES
jgi:hypothetical protein